MSTTLEHVVIIGCGLLGTSLGLAIRHRRLARVVTGVGRTGSPSVATALSRGALDRACDDPALAVRGDALPGDTVPVPPADAVILCTPVGTFAHLFQTLAPALRDGALVTDVGSTKRQVLRWAAEYLPQRVHFVGSHPMAGSEKSGPAAGRHDLYDQAVCLVCPPEPPNVVALARTVDLWRPLGMRIVQCSAEQHDLWTAAVSHLPYAIASSLVRAAAHDPAALESAAGGFIDTSRIASGDVAMWTDILLTNHDALVQQIDLFIAELAALRRAIERGDEPAIRARLESAKHTRDAFLAWRAAAQLSPTQDS